MSPRKQPVAAWHTLSVSDLSRELDATELGLSEAEAVARLTEYGPNKLPRKPPATLWQIVPRQFRSPLIYTLALAAIVSVAIGDVKDAAFIAGVLVLNAVIGAYQEWKAEQSSHALRKLLQIRASVHRDGNVREVNAEEVVPCDVVWLESGNRVPADIRLLSAHGLEVDESLLTGESLSVLKDPAWRGVDAAAVADRLNMSYAGSIVTRGRANGLVVATGTATSVGQRALDVLGEAGGKPPLLVRMERFTRVIAFAVLAAAAFIGILGVTVGGYSLSEMFLFAVALAVSAIPEGLPVAMTVAPALRVANIGVAMGKSGTDVAREAAELVISDDNFATIVGGVEEGHVAYDNIRKVIYLLISTGAAELVLMALAVATATPYLLLLPVQLLWLNLVTNGIQDVALAFEPNEGDVLQRKPRAPRERIFNQLMNERTVIAAAVMGVVGFLTFRWFLPDDATDAEVASARNALLLLMVLFENIHIGNCRSETKSALRFSPLRSPVCWAGR